MNSQFLSTLLAAAAKRPYKRRVSYLESTGTQYIDTGVTPDQATNIEISVEGIQNSNSYWFGIRPTSDVSVNNISGRGIAVDFANGSYFSYRATLGNPDPTAQYVCILSRTARQWRLNGEVVAQSTAYNSDVFTTNLTYLIFAANGQANRAPIKCFGCQIKNDQGKTVRNFIPVIDWNDRPAMYDRVSRQLFYNQGTDEFIVEWRDDELFTLDLNITSENLRYGFQPYWNVGGWCHVLDWGDNSSTVVTSSGATTNHTYAAPGSYKVKIRANLYRAIFRTTNPGALIDCNGNWEALGDITNGQDMFNGCTNALLTFTSLPKGLTNGSYMFSNCGAAILPLLSLPDTLSSAVSMFGGCTNALLPLIKLPDILTSGYGMFGSCASALLPLRQLPQCLTNGYIMFSGCMAAELPLESLPDSLITATQMFNRCTNALIRLTSLPIGITTAQDMFNGCVKATIDLNAVVDHTPGEFSDWVNMGWMFSGAGSANTPGTVTGYIASFMRKFPNVNYSTATFANTATTTFGIDDYFEIVLKTTTSNQVWGFTAISDKGRWYCYDWGDGAAPDTSKNLATFTSGTKVTHTFSTPRTYRIKLATAPCNIVFDAYDSDNGNYWALGWEDNETFDIDIDLGLTPGNLQFGVTPYLNTDGECFIDWGDGTIQRITPTANTVHTYTEADKYTVKVRGNMYQFRVGSTGAAAVTDCNGNWEALGELTSGASMFRYCGNAMLKFDNIPSSITDGSWMFSACSSAELTITELPDGLTNGQAMFYGCKKSQLPITELPAGLVSVNSMFYDCTVATLPLTSLPDGITNGTSMFGGCANAILSLTSLPSGLTNGSGMFKGCSNATFTLTELPSALTNGAEMFNACANAHISISELPPNLTAANTMFAGCRSAEIRISALPSSVTAIRYMFRECYKAVIDLNTLASNAPAGGWDTDYMLVAFCRNAGSTGGTVTGSVASFMQKLPNIYSLGDAFTGTNTTTFDDSDYFEFTVTTTQANQVWGFTSSSEAGRWYCFDWGDGTAVTANKNLDVFTNGTRIQHTFKNPGTYHIKLAMNADVLDTDAYDSDNGAYGMLTNDSIVFNGALYNGSMDFIEYTAQDLSILMGNDITYTDGTILIN